MIKTFTVLLKKTIYALLCAAFVAALLLPTIAVGQSMKNMDMKKSSTHKSTANAKRHHKKTVRHYRVRHTHKAKVDRSQSTLERGVNTSAHKAGTFTQRTLTVPQKHPNASHRPANRKRSTLQRGVGTSEHKTRKFLKRTFTAPHEKK